MEPQQDLQNELAGESNRCRYAGCPWTDVGTPEEARGRPAKFSARCCSGAERAEDRIAGDGVHR